MEELIISKYDVPEGICDRCETEEVVFVIAYLIDLGNDFMPEMWLCIGCENTFIKSIGHKYRVVFQDELDNELFK